MIELRDGSFFLYIQIFDQLDMVRHLEVEAEVGMLTVVIVLLLVLTEMVFVVADL